MPNFNISRSPEYDLYNACTREMIDLYGIECKLVLVKKLGVSSIVNEWASIQTDGEKIFDICVLPESAEAFDSMDYQFNNFGFIPTDNMTCYISASALDAIIDFREVISNLIVLPSGKVMEITDINQWTQQTNNLYAYPDDKTAYTLRLVPYEFKLHDRITDKHLIGDPDVIDPDAEVIGELKTSLYKFNEKKSIPSKSKEDLEAITRENYKVLGSYLESLEAKAEQQDLEVRDPKDPIYDTSEVDIWHKYQA